MENEELNDTPSEIELPLDESTETIEEETVEPFEEALESAETDEDFAKLGEAARGDINEEEEDVSNEEPAMGDANEEVDTKQEEVSEGQFSIGKGFNIKDGDIELTITDETKLRQLAQMGLNYAGKTSELAKHRSFVKYAEDNEISLDDIQMLRDIKSGNKDAYSALAKSSGIDVYDVSNENTYNPAPVQLPTQIDPMVETIASEILADEGATKQFKEWVNPDRMPQEVVNQITTDPNALRAVQADIQAGVFDRAMKQAYSDVRLNGMEFNQAYLRAKEMIVGTESPQAAPQQPITRGDRVRASSGRGSASAKSKNYGTISDMTNDDFLENFNDIIANLERPQ